MLGGALVAALSLAVGDLRGPGDSAHEHSFNAAYAHDHEQGARGGPVEPAAPLPSDTRTLALQSALDLEVTERLRNERLDALMFAAKEPRGSIGPVISTRALAGPPVRVGRVTSRYGWRRDPIAGSKRFHSGIDFAAPRGTPVFSVAAGVVIFAGDRKHYGNVVEIYHGGGLSTRYAHNHRNSVRPGDRIEPGDLIAEVGSTGRTTGNHLHFEVRHDGQPINPKGFLLRVGGRIEPLPNG